MAKISSRYPVGMQEHIPDLVLAKVRNIDVSATAFYKVKLAYNA